MKKILTLVAIATIILVACNSEKRDDDTKNVPASTEEAPPAVAPADTTAHN